MIFSNPGCQLSEATFSAASADPVVRCHSDTFCATAVWKNK